MVHCYNRIFQMKLLITLVSLFLVYQLVKYRNNSDIQHETQKTYRILTGVDEAFKHNIVAVESGLQFPSLTKTKEQPNVKDRIKQIIQCTDANHTSRIQERGDYWVLYNYVRAEQQYRCHESITFTTHADYRFLDNLVPLVERWRGPVSIAVYASSRDFDDTLDSIFYLRKCLSPLIRRYVTFHVYYNMQNVSKRVPGYNELSTKRINCSESAPYMNSTYSRNYKTQNQLLYPVNVGRNIARESAQTYYVLPSDIELYPSLDLIVHFLAMIVENDELLRHPTPKVFPISVFEVLPNQHVPDTKSQLKKMLANGTAFPFHENICPECHSMPKSKEWQTINESNGLHIFHIEKRIGDFVHWEPIFIGTNMDPLYDERLSWEGQRDKMTQGYVLCMLDYDFMILDNAFLVHKPGIKVYKKDQSNMLHIAKTNQLIEDVIFPELQLIYGYKSECAI